MNHLELTSESIRSAIADFRRLGCAKKRVWDEFQTHKSWARYYFLLDEMDLLDACLILQIAYRKQFPMRDLPDRTQFSCEKSKELLESLGFTVDDRRLRKSKSTVLST